MTEPVGHSAGAATQATSAHIQPRTARLRTVDDEFSDFVQEVPGFGGLYLDGASETSPGRITVTVTRPGAVPDAAIRTRVGRLLERMGRSDLKALAATDGVSTVRGAYDFAQLRRWYPHATALLANGGVLRTDIDERRNRIVVGVSDETQRRSVVEHLARAGVPRAAVSVEVTPPLHLTARLSDPVRPIIGGTAINDVLSEQRCTLGYVWIHGGVRHVVTNAHCTGGVSAVGSVSGTVMYQPRYSALVDNAIGEEAIDPPFFDNSVDPNCPAGLARGCRYSDAAAFRIYDHVSTDRNGHPTWIADSGGGTDSLATIVGYHKISGFASMVAGDYLRKVGSRTGYSQGTLRATCSNENSGGSSPYVLLCQGVADYPNEAGDSGSPVYQRRSDGSRWVVGLHWGKRFTGEALFSPTHNVHFEVFNCLSCGRPGG